MLHAKGVPATVHWPSPPPTLPAAQFAHTFFAALHNPTVTPAEAFALASHVTNAHCTTWGEGRHVPPPLPVLLAPDGQRPQLPDNSSVPPPVADGMDFSQGVAAAVPGWADVRLLAPRAELPLRLCGGQPLIDSHRLSFLGEALRALLVMELRQLTLVDVQPCGRPAASSHLPPSCQEGVRCELRTASGATTAVVLAGVSGVLQLRPLVEHALRQTLVSDSLSLQFRLSPPGILLPPVPQVLPDVACSAPVIEAMVLTSLWAVHVLRLLAQDASFKGLMALGVAAVSSAPVAAASHVDAQRMHMIATGLGPETLGQGFYGGPDGARAAAAAALVSAMDGAEGVETGTAGLTTSCGEEIELPSELPEDGGPLMMAAAAAPLADGPSASGSVPLPPGARASEAPAPGLLTQEDNSSAMAAATPAPADRGVGRGIEPAAPPAAGGGSTAGG